MWAHQQILYITILIVRQPKIGSKTKSLELKTIKKLFFCIFFVEKFAV